MVKYLITLFIVGIASTMLYQQPACNAANAKSIVRTKGSVKKSFPTLGKQIQEERLKKNWTTSDFALATRITSDDLENIETEKSTPTKTQLYKIEETLETTFEIE